MEDVASHPVAQHAYAYACVAAEHCVDTNTLGGTLLRLGDGRYRRRCDAPVSGLNSQAGWRFAYGYRNSFHTRTRQTVPHRT